ncbi:unnamed protein product, partial [Symbiodinium natans]
ILQPVRTGGRQGRSNRHDSQVMGSGCTKTSASSTKEFAKEGAPSPESPLRTEALETPLPNVPNVVDKEVHEAHGALGAPVQASLGPLVTALVSQKLDHILQEEVPVWDASCRSFGRLQSQDEMEQDASVHERAKIHREFLARLENYFQDVCSQTGISTPDVAQLLHKEAARSDGARLILNRLLKYTDYNAFAKLMHGHFWATVKEVRLFWDIENVGWDEMQHSGRDVVKGLRDFLDARNLGGFAAQLWAVAPTWRFAESPRVVDDLEDAAIQAVNCKSKPEAADHVIKGEIEKAALLYGKYEVPAHTVVFILITSDQDFTDVLQRLKYAGYKTVLIHNARKGSRHVDMMSLYASHAFSWKEVLPALPAPRRSDRSDWQRLLDWARGRVHPAVWVNAREEAPRLWRVSLQFGRGCDPNEINLSEGETKQGAARAALECLAKLLGDQVEVSNLEQRVLHTALSQGAQAERQA